VLPAENRLRTSKEFELVTKTGERATSLSLVIYYKTIEGNQVAPRVGLIVNSSVGGSVTRHRVSRQLRHAIAPYLVKFPKNANLVIRVLRKKDSYNEDLTESLNKLLNKVSVAG
jgi:ribonuclease P protein component